MIYAQYNIIMYLIVVTVNLLPFVFSAPKGNDANLEDATSYVPGSSFNTKFISSYQNSMRSRVKRQVGSGAGKYVEAAKMPQLKVLRLFLQLIKNLFSSSPIGGAGPFDADSCKPVLYLFKDKIIEYFFPDPRVEHKEKSH